MKLDDPAPTWLLLVAVVVAAPFVIGALATIGAAQHRRAPVTSDASP